MVEGVTDFWYLTTVSAHLEAMGRTALKDVVLTSAGGAQKVSYMVALLTAQDLRVVVLLDSEPKAAITKKDLIASKLIRSENVVHVEQAYVAPPSDGADTEDLLGDDVYLALVREAYSKELKGINLDLKSQRWAGCEASRFGFHPRWFGVSQIETGKSLFSEDGERRVDGCNG